LAWPPHSTGVYVRCWIVGLSHATAALRHPRSGHWDRSGRSVRAGAPVRCIGMTGEHAVDIYRRSKPATPSKQVSMLYFLTHGTRVCSWWITSSRTCSCLLALLLAPTWSRERTRRIGRTGKPSRNWRSTRTSPSSASREPGRGWLPRDRVRVRRDCLDPAEVPPASMPPRSRSRSRARGRLPGRRSQGQCVRHQPPVQREPGAGRPVRQLRLGTAAARQRSVTVPVQTPPDAGLMSCASRCARRTGM
jgi:hypothetical protein